MQNASRAPQPGELLLDYVSPDGPVVTHVRGTLLATSLRVVKDADLYDGYVAALPKQHVDTLLYSVASSWLPVDVMLAHYETLGSLGIPDEAIERNAEKVGARIAETFMATLLRTAQSMGVPGLAWMILKQSDRVFGRLFMGGACRVYRVGPSEALVEHRGLPLAQCRYYRVAHVANVRGVSRLFGKSQVRQARAADAEGLTMAVSIKWNSE